MADTSKSTPMQSSSLQSCRVMGVATNRPADSTAMGPMGSSPYQVTTSSGGCVRHPAHPSRRIVARHEAGQFLSQTGAAGHLPSILAVDSAVSKRVFAFTQIQSPLVAYVTDEV